MLQKLNWESVPTEEVNPSMHRKIVWGEKLMIAKMKFTDGFIVPLHHHVHEQVTQVISGSIGFDDWEWGVDLFAQDPLVFKKLIYEMRFDEASAKFAEFGPFYTGLQFAPGQLASFLDGQVPTL